MKSYLVSAYKKINYKKVIEAKNKNEAEKIFMESVNEVYDADTVDNYVIEKVYKCMKCE